MFHVSKPVRFIGGLLLGTSVFVLSVGLLRGQTLIPRVECESDSTLTPKCYSPGDCPRSGFYCDDRVDQGWCSYVPTFSDCLYYSPRNCGTKYQCSTGMPVVPPEDCSVNWCESDPA